MFLSGAHKNMTLRRVKFLWCAFLCSFWSFEIKASNYLLSLGHATFKKRIIFNSKCMKNALHSFVKESFFWTHFFKSFFSRLVQKLFWNFFSSQKSSAFCVQSGTWRWQGNFRLKKFSYFRRLLAPCMNYPIG